MKKKNVALVSCKTQGWIVGREGIQIGPKIGAVESLQDGLGEGALLISAPGSPRMRYCKKG